IVVDLRQCAIERCIHLADRAPQLLANGARGLAGQSLLQNEIVANVIRCGIGHHLPPSLARRRRSRTVARNSRASSTSAMILARARARWGKRAPLRTLLRLGQDRLR